MSEATKTPRRSLTEVVTTRVKPLERLALEQAAEAGNTTVSRVARQAILRGLKQPADK